jgi:LSD1 subclass zinc finger protein
MEDGILRLWLQINRKGSLMRVNSGPERESPCRTPLSNLKGAVNVHQSLGIAVHHSYVLDKSLAKANIFQYVEDLRVLHAVICRRLIKGYDGQWQVVQVGVVYGVSDEMEFGENVSIWYTI